MRQTYLIGFVLFVSPGLIIGTVLGAPLAGFCVAMCIYSVWGTAVWRNYNEHATLPWSHQHNQCAPVRWGSMTSNDYGAIMRRDGVARREPLMIVLDGRNSIAPQWMPSEPLRVQQPQMVRREPIIVGREALPHPEMEAESQGAPVWLVAEDEPEPAVVAVGCRPSRWDYLEIR